jgi:hypothetical protein
MRFRIAVVVAFIAVLLGCGGSGPTEPKEVAPVAPVVTNPPVPEPAETPPRGCSQGNCDR